MTRCLVVLIVQMFSICYGIKYLWSIRYGPTIIPNDIIRRVYLTTLITKFISTCYGGKQYIFKKIEYISLLSIPNCHGVP